METPPPVRSPLPDSVAAQTAVAAPPGSPFLVGWRAAKANIVPGLCVQGFVLVVIYAYYWLPYFRPWFDRLGEYKRGGGYLFTLGSALVAGALLPALFTLTCLERRWPARRDVGDFVFACGFYGVSSLTVDWLYRWQGVWFGTANTVSTVVKKVLVDQLIYNPVFAVPFTVVCFAWKNQGYTFDVPAGSFTPRNYVRRAVPTLLTTWAVWIPVVAVLYSLPPLLQIPVYSLALCFWALLLAYIHARPKPAAGIRSAVPSDSVGL